MVANGIVEPIDLGASEADYSPVAINALTTNGALYGLPYATENVGLLRNTDLVPEAPATMADLEEVALLHQALDLVDVFLFAQAELGGETPGQHRLLDLAPQRKSLQKSLVLTDRQYQATERVDLLLQARHLDKLVDGGIDRHLELLITKGFEQELTDTDFPGFFETFTLSGSCQQNNRRPNIHFHHLKGEKRSNISPILISLSAAKGEF